MTSIITEESNLYFVSKLKAEYSDNFKVYNICKNSYGYLYLRHGNIDEDDIFWYIGALIFMGLHLYPLLIKYSFKMLSSALHIPVKEKKNPIDNPSETDDDLEDIENEEEKRIIYMDIDVCDNTDNVEKTEFDPRNKIDFLSIKIMKKIV